MIGTTSFDGFSQGTTWNSIVAAPAGASSAASASTPSMRWSARAPSACSSCAARSGCSTGSACWGCARSGGGCRRRELARRVRPHARSRSRSPTCVAHYFSLLAYQGQAIAATWSPTRSATAPTCFGTAHDDHRLHVDQRDGHLVRPGRRARPRPRRRPDARPRPRAGALRPARATRRARSTGCSRSWSPSPASACGCCRRRRSNDRRCSSWPTPATGSRGCCTWRRW